MIYLDYAATTPVDDRVLEAMIPYFCDIFSNPSSKHSCGKKAEQAVDDGRKTLADLLGAKTPSEIIFTAGASEANNLAIKGVAESYDSPRHFIISSFEHKCALRAMRCLEEWGHRVTYVAPGRDGVVNPADIQNAILPDTVLCSVMLVNNEIGTVQPVDDIAQVCHDQGVLFHTDATQGFGKLPIRVSDIDMLSMSAHKFYGPKGIGALYCSGEIPIKCQISGGSQENGLRAGTLNVPGIVGMAKAAQISCDRMREYYEKMEHFEHRLLEGIKHRIPMAYTCPRVMPPRSSKVPWICNVCFYGVDGGYIQDELGKREICVSRSSACAKSQNEPSHVLQAIGIPPELSSCAIRFSFGSRTTDDRIDATLDALVEIVNQRR